MLVSPKIDDWTDRKLVSFLKIFQLYPYTPNCFSLFSYHHLDSNIKFPYKILKLFSSLDLLLFYFCTGMNYREFGDQASKVKLGQLGEVCRARESMTHLKKVDFFSKQNQIADHKLFINPVLLLIKLSVQFKDRIPV